MYPVINHLKTVFFILICIAVGIGIGQAYVWWSQPPKRGFEKSEGPPLITGVGDAPEHRGFTLRPDRLPSATTLKEWENTHATTIGIPCDASLTESALADTVKLAHAHSFQVVLLPPSLGQGAGSDKIPFPNASITNAATLAQQAKVDFLCVSDLGQEPDLAYWRSAIAEARTNFTGKIILAARPQVIFQIDSWDLTDLIGVVGPIPLAQRLPDAPNDVTLHDMRVAWDCSLTSLESLARINRKKLALLNMNVPADISARLPAPDSPLATSVQNPALQRLVYEALLTETKGRAFITDMLLFNWGEPADLNAPNNVPGLMTKFAEAWDPQKPRLADTAPAEPPADTADGTFDGADGAAGN